VTRSGASSPLTPTEVRLLHALTAQIDHTVPTDTLLNRVWSESDGADPSYVWVTIRRLRRKLESDPDRPRFLLTERGVGYRLVSVPQAGSATAE
jgi:Response regulators consisting of a CheY-like receiver domain and a winged-helix DNA-binding domain